MKGGWYIVAVVCLAAWSAEACDVPVFHYALDRWPADEYEVFVFHRGPFSAAQRSALARLNGSSADGAPAGGGAVGNYAVRTVDLGGEVSREMQKLWRSLKRDKLPALAARYPANSQARGVAWVSDLTGRDVAVLVDSPARRQIVGRILGGDSAVWVLVESGQKARDDAAARLLQKELKRAAETVKLPAGDEGGEDDQTAGPAEIRLAFSLLRVSRNQPAEKATVNMLVRSESDLEREFSSQPMVFPIFGRGRVLYALVGGGITGDNIRRTCGFLAGPCSCQVKAENPGTDLLMVADWPSELLLPPGASEALVLPGALGLGEPGAEPGAASPAPAAQPSLNTGGGLARNLLIAIGLIVIAAVGVTVGLKRKLSRK